MDFLNRQNAILAEMRAGEILEQRDGRFRKQWYLGEQPIGQDIINMLVSSNLIRVVDSRAELVEETLAV